jgi:hypothetical protein
MVFRCRTGTEKQRLFHLFERTVVAMACLVSRKERMWQRMSFGKALIISSFAIEIGEVERGY